MSRELSRRKSQEDYVVASNRDIEKYSLVHNEYLQHYFQPCFEMKVEEEPVRRGVDWYHAKNCREADLGKNRSRDLGLFM